MYSLQTSSTMVSAGAPFGPGGLACLRYLFRSGCFVGSDELGVGGPFSVRVGSGSFSCTTKFNLDNTVLSPCLTDSFLTKFHRSWEGLGPPFCGLCVCIGTKWPNLT